MSLVCPMCSEALEVEGAHFYKHFKYKRYACGEQSCDLEFYTEADRNAHCSKYNHKRSFQKTVNPYIDKMIGDLVFDARELATKDMETVIESRWNSIRTQQATPTFLKSSASTSALQEKSSSRRSKEGTERIKRSLISTTPGTAKKARRKERDEEEETTPSRRSKHHQSTEVVDSTTSDQMTPTTVVEKTKRKKRTDSELNQSNSSIGGSDSIEKMSALEKLVGWFDENAPERREEARVTCALCGDSIIYDFILRKGHVTKNHMAADADPADYLELLENAMDNCFPEMPNSDLACQLCMKNTPIRKCARREHTENQHTNSLIPLKCPECDQGYRRQCDLATHMKETHKIQMSRLKNMEFQYIRRRRNFQISEMIKKCFPWSEVEKLEQIAAAGNVLQGSESRVELNGEIIRDVRILEANKTRRAPRYNQNDSDSDSEHEHLDEHEKESSETEAPPPGANEDFSQDVIFIGEQFNSQIAQLLGQRNACLPVKAEPRSEEHEELQIVGQEIHVDLEHPEEHAEEDVKDEETSIPQPGLVLPELQSNYTPLIRCDTSVPPPAFIAPAEPYQNEHRNYHHQRRPHTPSRNSDRYQENRNRRNDYNNHNNQRNRNYVRSRAQSSNSSRYHSSSNYDRRRSTYGNGK